MNSVQDDISKETVELLTAQCSSLLYNAADAAGVIKQSNPILHRKLKESIHVHGLMLTVGKCGNSIVELRTYADVSMIMKMSML